MALFVLTALFSARTLALPAPAALQYTGTFLIESNSPCLRSISFFPSNSETISGVTIRDTTFNVSVIEGYPADWIRYRALLLNNCPDSPEYTVDEYSFQIQTWPGQYNIHPELYVNLTTTCLHNLCHCEFDVPCVCNFLCLNRIVTITGLVTPL